MHFSALSILLALFCCLVTLQARVFDLNIDHLVPRAGVPPAAKPPPAARPDPAPESPAAPEAPPAPEAPSAPKSPAAPKPPTRPGGQQLDPPKLPTPLTDEVSDDQSVFKYNGFQENDQVAMFKNFGRGQDQYFVEAIDVFAYHDYPVTPSIYADATGTNQPFKSGTQPPTGQQIRVTRNVVNPNNNQPTPQVTVFDPSKPTDVCGAWSTLINYCGTAGTECGCYSGTYYVPDQWNSLAAWCAKHVTDTMSPCANNDQWCNVAKIAHDYTDYCPTDGINQPVYGFAAATETADPTTRQAVQTQPASTTRTAAPSTTSMQPTTISGTQTSTEAGIRSALFSTYTSSASSTPTSSSAAGRAATMDGSWQMSFLLLGFFYSILYS